MYGKAKVLGTVLTAQMMCEKEDSLSLDSDCMTRMMTPEDWEKYGPVNLSESRKVNNRKLSKE